MPLEPDWDDFAALAHRAVDDMVAHLKGLPGRPAWQPVPDDSKDRILSERLPIQGIGEEAAYASFCQDVMPFTNGNVHPRHFGWVQGSGLPFGMLADFLASSINPHMAGFNQAPRHVEETLIKWMVELMGFPEYAGGVIESGGTMANTLALHVAWRSVPRHRWPGDTIYCTQETHGWLWKAVKFLNIGLEAIRVIKTDDQYRMDLVDLKDNIRRDKEDGRRPFCVVANAGTVQTGAFDDLETIYDITGEEKLWLHVDAAFGAVLRLVPSKRHLVAGLEKADSVVFDLHKWLYMPFEIACLLVSDGEQLTDTFQTAPSYIAAQKRGVIAGGLPFTDTTMDLTRNFKSLKAWMCLRAYGVEAFASAIERNLAQTELLVNLIEASEHLELSAPAPANVVCFRFVAPGLDNAAHDALNTEVLFRVQESGDAVPSSTVVNGRFVLRYCNVNHRTTDDDIRLLVDSVERHGRDVLLGSGQV